MWISTRLSGLALTVVVASAAGIAPSSAQSLSRPSPQTVKERAGSTNHVFGTVVYVDTSLGVFVQVGAETVRVRPSEASTVASGDRVEATGHALIEHDRRTLEDAILVRLGSGALPQARPVSPSALRATDNPSDWVEFDGIVREIRDVDGHSELSIGLEAERATLTVVAPPQIPGADAMIDATVRIRGLRQLLRNVQNVLTGVRVLAPRIDERDIVQPPPAKPYDLPVLSAAAIRQAQTTVATAHRVRMKGTIVLQHFSFIPSKRVIYVQDASGAFGVEVEREGDLAVGDEVDVAAFPTSFSGALFLTSGVFRRLGRGVAPIPRLGAPRDLLSGQYQAELVRVRGVYMGSAEISTFPSGKYLTLQAGSLRVPLVMYDWPPNGPIASLREGSLLEVTGVSGLGTDLEGGAGAVSTLILRSPDDVRVITAASWWTRSHLATVALGTTSLGVLALAWIVFLNARIRRQTRQLAEQFERTVTVQRQWSDLVATASDVILTWNLEGRLTSLNSTGEILTGRTEASAQQLTLKDLVTPESVERAEAVIRWADSDRGAKTHEIEMIGANGEPIPIELSVQPMFHNRAHVGFQAIGRNVSDRRRVEAVLREARDAAEEANRAKSEFLANMSHEIRTPMNGVIGMTELVLTTDLATDQREYMETVKSSAESLLGLLNGILDFSKIESGKLEFESVPVVVRDLVAETLKPLSFKADDRGLELLCEIAPEVPHTIIGDPLRLRQVLTNLVGNAIKFTERGHILIGVREQSRAEGCTSLLFTITDTGVGISKEKHALIFDPFSQADGSTTRRYGGSGLGLTICATLVRMMGGRIWVESEPGKGSTFQFTGSFDVTSGAEPPAADGSLADLRVLIVDDNPVNRRILADQVARWRMIATLADGGAAALAALTAAAQRGEPFALVLLDANMPDVDGFTVAEQISARPDLADATIMMLSSAGQYGDTGRCKALNIAAYLTKPVAAPHLLDVIRRVIGRGRLVSQPTARGAVVQARRTLKVLLAEDNIVNQRVAVGLLARRGHETTVAANGREALEWIARARFDVVLMDVQMPEMGGLEATSAIRQREAGNGEHIRIIAMTAHAMNGDRDRCLSGGMDGYLSKPINPAMLYAVIEDELPPAATRGGTASLDDAALLERLGGDQELFSEVIQAFLEDCPARLAAIRTAVDQRDVTRLRAAAHALKGAAGNLSATALFAAAGTLEQLATAGRVDAFEAGWQQLSSEASLVLDALRRSETTKSSRIPAPT